VRAKEFIKESVLPLSSDVARAMPGTYAIGSLPNSDFYKQYRFGVAIAGAKGRKARENDNLEPYQMKGETVWGENMIVSSYMDSDIGADIDEALGEIDLPKQKNLISTPDSHEAIDVGKRSPINSFKGYN
jgi:hypothetical protein